MNRRNFLKITPGIFGLGATACLAKPKTGFEPDDNATIGLGTVTTKTKLNFSTSGREIIRIDPLGNVGIGTSSG